MTDKTPHQKSPEFLRKIGSIGGKATKSRPFRDQPGLASRAGAKGGKASKTNNRYGRRGKPKDIT